MMETGGAPASMFNPRDIVNFPGRFIPILVLTTVSSMPTLPHHRRHGLFAFNEQRLNTRES